MRRIVLTSSITVLIGAFALIAIGGGTESAEAGASPRMIAAQGVIPGQGMAVHVLVRVPVGMSDEGAAHAALAAQGARPMTASEFSLLDLKWDQFFDGTSNPTMLQHYNDQNAPFNVVGASQLAWNDVDTSSFEFSLGNPTNRCPSLVQECRGRQKFDGNNDIAWMAINDPNTLAVTWTGTSTDEADIAMNTRFTWANDNVKDVDALTVLTHEQGHAAGIGHSEVSGSIMLAVYSGPQRDLGADDIAAITAAYPSTVTAPPGVTISIDSPADGKIVEPEEAIDFSGSVTSTTGVTSDDIEWLFNGSPAGTGPTGTVGAPVEDGPYVLTAKVTDADKTAEASITINVVTPVTPPDSLSVAIIIGPGAGPYVKGDTVSIEVTVTEGAVPVPGAIVQVTVLTTSGRTLSGSQTTDGAGLATVTYKVNSKRDGTGTFEVTASATLSGVEGSGDTTFEVR